MLFEDVIWVMLFLYRVIFKNPDSTFEIWSKVTWNMGQDIGYVFLVDCFSWYVVQLKVSARVKLKFVEIEATGIVRHYAQVGERP